MKYLASFLAIVALSGVALAQGAAPAGDKETHPKKEGVPMTPIKPGPKAEKPKGDAPSLKVGDAAPALACDEFIKGDAVKEFEKGKVYVVEFWATWCPPCLKSIPHLSEMQKEHKDLTVIGMASSEHGSGAEVLTKLKDFVKKQGDKMGYRVAYDSKRAMSKAWMEPAGQDGIPCAFVVDGEGKLAFIGHPMGKDFGKAVEGALAKASKK